jgi:hypothetical protein
MLAAPSGADRAGGGSHLVITVARATGRIKPPRFEVVGLCLNFGFRSLLIFKIAYERAGSARKRTLAGGVSCS